MRTSNLVEKFLSGATEGKASNLRIEGNQLIFFRTCIAYRDNAGGIILNGKHYSQSTSRHQNQIRRQAPSGLLEKETEKEFVDYIKDIYNIVVKHEGY